jgi:hypothetical protein
MSPANIQHIYRYRYFCTIYTRFGLIIFPTDKYSNVDKKDQYLWVEVLMRTLGKFSLYFFLNCMHISIDFRSSHYFSGI